MTMSSPVLKARVPVRLFLALTALCCLVAASASCSRFADEETATKGSLAVLASESHFELIQAEAEEFTSLYKDARVAVSGATTREAIVQLLNDSVSVVVVDRMLNQEEERVAREAKLKLERIEVALDAVAVVVNHLNDADGISRETLNDVLVRKITDWNQVRGSGLSGPVELVLTGKNSGTYELVKDHFFSLSQDIQASVVLSTQKEVIEYVARHPQAVGLAPAAVTPSFA